MKNLNVEEQYSNYMRTLYPEGVIDLQMNECRKAWYSGMLILINHMLGEMADAPDQEGEDDLGAIVAQIKEFMENNMIPVKKAERPVMDKQYMREAAALVKAKLPDNHGFLLLSCPFGEGKGRMVYVSDMQRADAVNLVKEWLIKAGAEEDWMKHLP